MGQLIFEYILYPICFLLLQTSFIYIKSFFITIAIKNDVSVDIDDDESSFQFSPEAGLISPLYVYITLATDTEAESLCFAQLLQCY